jgi:hypothetical protein
MTHYIYELIQDCKKYLYNNYININILNNEELSSYLTLLAPFH